MLVGTIAFTLLFALILISIEFKAIRDQQKRIKELELVPNCLLTRYPLVFVTGRRSLFYFLNYWNQIPAFLREHGYEVQVLSLPWREPRMRAQTLRRFLENRQRPCHLLGDASIEDELINAKSWNLSSVASVTMVKCEARGLDRKNTVRSEDLKPRPTTVDILTVPARSSMGLRGPLLALHNLIFVENGLNANEIGLFAIKAAKNPFELERKFLDHAIFLAERDAQ